MQLKLNYQNIGNFILNINIKALLIPFAALVFLLHFYIYTKYFQNIYVDSDQLIVALAAKNYASFNIPEPFFFGQKHLFLIESFLSVPLIWFGLRPDLSVNLMCGILFYSPFLIAIIYLRKINLAICSSILLLPFIIDTKFTLIALLPRGFMGAIGLGAIATLIFLLDNRDKLKKMALILLGVCVGSYTAALLYVPLLIMRYENFSQSLKNFLFLSIGYFVIKSFAIFYYYHPEYVVFPSPDFNLTINTLKHSLSSFSILNAPFSSFPILWFLLSMLIIDKNYKSNRPNEPYKKAIFAASGIIFIIFLMMSAKHINATSNSIFYSGARFYLALPFCALIIVSKLACFNPPLQKI